MTFLRVESISKVYENQPRAALDDVSFSIEKGELVALVGESGSGKSTLLNIISGLLQPDEGEVYLNGEPVKGPIDKLVPGHDEIKVVFQHYDLMPFHTVEENIRFVIRNFDEEFQEEKLDTLITVCALDGFIHKKPGQLSGGQQQRVAIAKALASEPELLLMDEPFSSVDSQLKAHLEAAVFGYIKSLGLTCVFVTHDHQDALSLSERIIVLRAGEKLTEGTPQDIYYKPVDDYTASFFGAVNILTGDALNSLLGGKHYSPGAKYLIRGEFILFAKKGVEAQVNQRLFMGHFDKLMVTANGVSLQLFCKPNEYQVGEKVYLNFQIAKITLLS